MRLIILLILIAPVCSFGQKISANFSYGGNGVNSFIGQRSYFLNDSAFNIKNSLTFGLTIRLKTLNSFLLSSGAEIQQLKQTNFERVMVKNGEIP